MKKYRLYTSEGIHTIQCDSIKFKKSKNGLIALPKGRNKIEGVTVAMELSESAKVIAMPDFMGHAEDEIV
jgi:hypothetical protein